MGQQAPGAHQPDWSVLLQPHLDLQQLSHLHSKRVLLRADLNLPLTTSGAVADATRLDSVLPTLQTLTAKGARVVLCSHLGRPDTAAASAQNSSQKDFSLAPVAALLAVRLPAGVFVGLVADCVGPVAADAVAALAPGQVCLLENLRFHAGEVDNCQEFAQQLASLADVYVNDAFAVCHRQQASVTGVVQHVAECYPGLLLRTELRFLHAVCDNPPRPFGVVIGGAKVRDKIKVLHALLHKADVICIGGRMAFTFLAAEGVAVGKTQIEEDWLEACRELRVLAAQRGVQLLLPEDVVVARSMDDDCGCCTVPLTLNCCSQESPCVPPGCFGLDIGPKSSQAFTQALASCRSLFWNGPMGRFELPGFAAGTHAIARAVGALTAAGATTVVGGGDSVSAVKQLQPVPDITYISTGGGASLELVRGSVLPGIAALAAAAGTRDPGLLISEEP